MCKLMEINIVDEKTPCSFKVDIEWQDLPTYIKDQLEQVCVYF